MNKLARDEKGYAFILVLILLLLGSLLILPLLGYMSTGLKTGLVYEKKTNELYAADAGIEEGLWRIKYDQLGPSYRIYDFSTNWSYQTESLNGVAANVSIQNVWIPNNVTLSSLGLSASEARNIVERDITDNETNRLVVTGTALDEDDYRIKIDFYPAIDATDPLEVPSVGVWLPQGFPYAGSCNLATFDDSKNKYTETVTPYAGGEAVVWDFSAEPFLFTDLPPAELDPGDFPQSAEITFKYNGGDETVRPGAIAWIVTDGELSADIPISWDIDTRYYKITSTAGGTRIEAYASRSEMRNMYVGTPGDYLAIGNTLMTGGEIRNTLLSQSTADTKNPDQSYRIPSDANVMEAYLYWSGWFKCDGSHPKATLKVDDCSSLTNWTRSGTDWSVSNQYLQGHYDGGDQNDRYLTLKNPVPLNGRTTGSVVVGWEQSEGGDLEPLSDATNGDALQFQLYNATTGWSGLIAAFEDDIGSWQAYYYVVPQAYLTADFKIRFYMHGFGNSSEYCRIDNFHVGDVADRAVTFKIGNPDSPDYSGTVNALQFSILGNASNGEYSYSCKQNVTSLLEAYSVRGADENPTGNGQYTVAGVDSDTGELWSYAAWSMIIIYSSPQTAGHQLYLFDTFAFCNTNVDLDFDFDGQPGGDISGFLIPEPIENETVAARLTCFVGEGDGCYSGDFIALNALESYRTHPQDIPNSYKLWDGITLAPTSGWGGDPRLPNNASSPNNVWNSRFKISDTGESTVDGVDIDTFSITWASGLLHADDTEAHIDIYTSYENFNLIYLILSVRSKTIISGTTYYVIGGG